MDDRVIHNMIAGYALVDELAAHRIDLFAMGNLKYWLELNTTVLCGTDPVERAEYARHRQTTEERFYEEQDGGIRDLVEWITAARRSVWMRAAGLYVRLLSRPQLFVEGNHGRERWPSAISSSAGTSLPSSSPPTTPPHTSTHPR